MLPHQSRIIEEAKFDYSLLAKVFKKHEKQVVNFNAIIKEYDYDTDKDSIEILRQKEIFNKVMTKGMIKFRIKQKI